MCLYKAFFIIIRLILETTSLFNKFIKYKINTVIFIHFLTSYIYFFFYSLRVPNLMEGKNHSIRLYCKLLGLLRVFILFVWKIIDFNRLYFV